MSFKWNEETHTYELSQYSSVETGKRYLENIALLDLTIQNDADYNRVKESRTEINKAVKELSTKRKQMTAIALSSFVPQCIEIEKYGTELSSKLTKKMEDYKPSAIREKTFKLVIKSKDIKTIKKLEKQALKYGCEVSIE